MRYRFVLSLAVVASALMVTAPTANADSCWGASLYDAYQDGEGVVLHFSLFSGGDPGIADAFTLKRNGKKLFSNRVFSTDDADSSGTECWWYHVDEAYCAENPVECADCDDDGTAECLDTCKTAYHFTYEDTCVSPGEARYDLEPCGGWEELVVEDVGQDCPAGGCSVSGPGCGSPGAFATLLLLGVGLVAIGFSRRRR